ncbi:virion assembly protein [Yersinia phage vB_YenP_Rambo]|uniref:Virion assembly protein n=1 Tax=Yersinia phage vB_YenP_Rambo TaxID=2880894 RepID=A0AC61TNS0_9CAUD|nr:virion assembly protein [Yersinia phage vB_YenP_Rambo]
MGKVFKKVKKALKKVVKEATRPVKQVVGGLAGGADVPEMPAPTPAAAMVEAPTKEAEVAEEAQTESGRKKARAGGKKSLSVARSSGGGINI